jgi:hypothetical protein
MQCIEMANGVGAAFNLLEMVFFTAKANEEDGMKQRSNNPFS